LRDKTILQLYVAMVWPGSQIKKRKMKYLILHRLKFCSILS